MKHAYGVTKMFTNLCHQLIKKNTVLEWSINTNKLIFSAMDHNTETKKKKKKKDILNNMRKYVLEYPLFIYLFN